MPEANVQSEVADDHPDPLVETDGLNTDEFQVVVAAVVAAVLDQPVL